MDRWLLQCAEDFCHSWQVRTGRTNFFWARLTMWLFAVAVYAYLPWMPAVLRSIAIPNVVMASLYTMVFSWAFAKVERYYLTGADTAHPFTLRWRSMWFYRIAFILLSAWMALSASRLPRPLDWLVWSYVLAALFLIASMYFRCVIPLPPGIHREYKLQRARERSLRARTPVPTQS